MSATLKVEEDWDVGGGNVEGYLFEDGGLADAALAVEDEDVIDELAGEGALDPVEDVLAAEEHGLLCDWGSGNVRIDHL